MEKVYGYARVSSKEQSLQRQIESLIKYGVNERDIITDKESGKDFNRNGYKTLKESLLRRGDTLVVKELDRLGRNMQLIKYEWGELEDMGVNIVIIDTPLLNTKGKSDIERRLISNIVFELLSYLAEKERIKIKQRQAEGIKVARAKGIHLGRPKLGRPKDFETYYNSWKNGDITAVECMVKLNLKKTSFYKLVKEYENK